MEERLRVVIGDDNPAMLEAVTHLLQRDFRVVAALECAQTVVDEVSRLMPDILILDLSFGETNGLEIARKLKARLCRSKIVVLTVHEELEFIRAAFAAGASGYVFKSRMNVDLKTAIDTVVDNKVFIPTAPISQYDPDTAVP